MVIRLESVRTSHPRAASIESLARWWSSASKESRFALLKRTIEGDPQAPGLREVRLAIYLAEAEAGEIN